MVVVGLMSGTSADGTDVALVHVEGRPPRLRWRLIHFYTVSHPPEVREAILAATRPETGRVDALCRLHALLGEQFARAALEGIRRAGYTPDRVDLIGSHGQTVWHAPEADPPATLQLGNPAIIAERTGIPVVSDFRSRDMAAGGQGAPLVAYVDVLLLRDETRVRAAQNIGGIANVTFLPPTTREDLPILAFDTGPGNVLIDDMARRATGGRRTFDKDGQLARRGRVHRGLLEDLLRDPYYRQPPPKSTGRELFTEAYAASIWERGRRLGLSPEDLVATVTALTAHSIARAYRDFLPEYPQEVILSGGGAYNPTLVSMLREVLAPAQVRLSDEVGLPADAKEAIAFAILAYETWHGRPGNLPEATGAHHRVVLGSITPGRSR